MNDIKHDLKHKIENIINRNPQADDREIVFQLKQLLYETDLQDNIDKADAKIIADLVAENLRQLDDKTCRNAFIKSGFDDFDTQFGGFRLSEFVVVGGRPAMGKTQFLINVSLNISKTIPVLYVTLDSSEFLLTNRFIASVTEIPSCNILQHNLNVEQKCRLYKIVNEFANYGLLIHNSSNSITAIKALCQKQIQENGIKVIMVDYLQMIDSWRHRKYRELEVSYICRELKNLAKENNVCVIASSQLNRVVENRTGWLGKHPQLSDLRESGAIEQDADMVLFIHRPEYYGFTEDTEGNSLKNLVEINVAKNRNGRLGDFYLSKDDDFTNFRNINRLLELEEEPSF